MAITFYQRRLRNSLVRLSQILRVRQYQQIEATGSVSDFLDFVQAEIHLANDLFSEWTTTVRKLPDVKVGLAIGADIGIVGFQNLNNHLIAVGEAIVWASRMSSEAEAGQLLVNNLLFQALNSIPKAMSCIRALPKLSFVECKGAAKSGETFLARAVTFAEETEQE